MRSSLKQVEVIKEFISKTAIVDSKINKRTLKKYMGYVFLGVINGGWLQHISCLCLVRNKRPEAGLWCNLCLGWY